MSFQLKGRLSLKNKSRKNFEKDFYHDAFFCRDAAALARFWVWLEEEIHNDVTLTEVDVAEKLLEFRSKQEGFLDTSFDTISGKLTSKFTTFV